MNPMKTYTPEKPIRILNDGSEKINNFLKSELRNQIKEGLKFEENG